MSEKFVMPILNSKPPVTLTWPVTAQHRKQADINHGQTLERLRERGGLGWAEIADVLNGRGWATTRDRAAAEREVRAMYPDGVK